MADAGYLTYRCGVARLVGSLSSFPSFGVVSFNDTLVVAMPGLAENDPGGFP